MRSFVLLLQLANLAFSIIMVKRQDKGDWFSGIVTVQCYEMRAYEDSSGCQCEFGLTFSTENMTCYEGRGNYSRIAFPT